ncbi:MAG TPA: chemotaxis response regulator protein-glutamate methylesterase [Prolixibacteraceae bacterium]|nr:chemotaxis response regulator protein-glutamate methylesterase [Prolixibacteraceae bacterium]
MEKMFLSRKIKVLVVDDSVIFRRLLATAVESDLDLELIGTASDAFKAVEIIEQQLPDVITLDIEMPHMDGLTFLQKLMKQHPIPVIIVSSITKGNREICLDAFLKGAIDIIDKPTKLKSDTNLYEFYSFVCEKIKGASQANVRQKQRLLFDIEHIRPEIIQPVTRSFNKIVAIGASAGGTTAIEYILRRLPKNMPGMVITQHMPKGFTKMFASRLNDICEMEVIEANDNDMVVPGRVLIAPGNQHMIVNGTPRVMRINLLDSEPVNRHRPSVDVMFDSVAKIAGENAVGILLTGMGADGARGLLNMKNAGAYTIAQDKESSIVYGMPYQAAMLDAQIEILSLSKIPDYLIREFSQ